MDLFKEVKAIDADPDRRFTLIERAKAKDDDAVRLLFLHAIYLQVKRNKAIPVRKKPLCFNQLVLMANYKTNLEILYV
jgi:hypothetical protein